MPKIKCQACGDGVMVETRVPRFGWFARVTWILGSIVPVGAGAFVVSSGGMRGRGVEGPDLALALGLVVGAALPAVLVLSSASAWACFYCGHWITRTTPPPPPK